MNTIQTLCSRKSIRSYTGTPPTEEELKKILLAGEYAPVGRGQFDTVHLTVIKNPELLRAIGGAAAKMFNAPDIHPLYNAPVFVLVSAAAPEPGYENVTYSNAAIVAHNMIIEATELGIGACHIWGAVAAIKGNGEILKKLNLPEGFIPCCGAILGKTEEKYSPREIDEKRIAVDVI